MSVPYPNATQNVTNMIEIIQKANELSAGDAGGFANLLGYMILLIVTAITFISLSNTNLARFSGIKTILPPTFLICYITAVFLQSAFAILPDWVPVLPMIGLAGSIAFLFFEK